MSYQCQSKWNNVPHGNIILIENLIKCEDILIVWQGPSAGGITCNCKHNNNLFNYLTSLFVSFFCLLQMFRKRWSRKKGRKRPNPSRFSSLARTMTWKMTKKWITAPPMMEQLTVKGSVFIVKKCKNDTLTTMEWRYFVWLQKSRIFYSKMEAVMVYQYQNNEQSAENRLCFKTDVDKVIRRCW